MLPDNLANRIALRVLFAFVWLIAPLSALFVASALYLHASPLVLLPTRYALPAPVATALGWFCVVESLWLVVHTVGREAVRRGYWELHKETVVLGEEERWRLWTRICESAEDPWTWLGGFYSMAGTSKRAPNGAEDKGITSVVMDTVGSDNIKELLSELFFNVPLASVDKASATYKEINALLAFLEAIITHRRSAASTIISSETRPFAFPSGRSTHQTLLILTEPIRTSHHPLVFYAFILLASSAANGLLFAAGFRWYGTLPLVISPLTMYQRRSRRLLDRAQGLERFNSQRVENQIGYWYSPGSSAAQVDGRAPIVFMHGISGTYGPTPFILLLQYFTGRPIFIQEHPYVTMQLAAPSSILSRREVAAGAKRMLIRHGFVGEGKMGKAVVVAHSLGGGPATWLMRDCPEIIAGLVLIEPMSVFLHCADGPRNFFRTRLHTAGQIFFAFFAAEPGIAHFLSRHLLWSDSVSFVDTTTLPVSLLAAHVPPSASAPQSTPPAHPNYAPCASPCPVGPLPTIFFYAENDCILPVSKALTCLKRGGFTEEGKNLILMKGCDHAGILISPYWTREAAAAVDRVAEAGRALWSIELERKQQ